MAKTTWLCAALVVFGLAGPAAAAERGTLRVSAPNAIMLNAAFSVTINYANNASTPIHDPDTYMYISVHNRAGTALPLPPEKVTVTSNTPINKWNTGQGTQVGLAFSPSSREDLQPGWNSNHQLGLQIQMPPGTVMTFLSVAVHNHGNFSERYAHWQREVTVTTPPPPPPPPTTPAPVPVPSSPRPSPARSRDGSMPSPAESVTPSASVVPEGTPSPSPSPAPSESSPPPPLAHVASSGGWPWWSWWCVGVPMLLCLVALAAVLRYRRHARAG